MQLQVMWFLWHNGDDLPVSLCVYFTTMLSGTRQILLELQLLNVLKQLLLPELLQCKREWRRWRRWSVWSLNWSRQQEGEIMWIPSRPITVVTVCILSASPWRVVAFLGRCTSSYGCGYTVPSALLRTPWCRYNIDSTQKHNLHLSLSSPHWHNRGHT